MQLCSSIWPFLAFLEDWRYTSIFQQLKLGAALVPYAADHVLRDLVLFLAHDVTSHFIDPKFWLLIIRLWTLWTTKLGLSRRRQFVPNAKMRCGELRATPSPRPRIIDARQRSERHGPQTKRGPGVKVMGHAFDRLYLPVACFVSNCCECVPVACWQIRCLYGAVIEAQKL